MSHGESRQRFIQRFVRNRVSEVDHLLEAAREFGWLLADGEKQGLPREASFELAREHFRRHGQAMVDFGNWVTLETLEVLDRRKRAKEAQLHGEQSGDLDERNDAGSGKGSSDPGGASSK